MHHPLGFFEGGWAAGLVGGKSDQIALVCLPGIQRERLRPVGPRPPRSDARRLLGKRFRSPDGGAEL